MPNPIKLIIYFFPPLIASASQLSININLFYKVQKKEPKRKKEKSDGKFMSWLVIVVQI